MKEERMKVKVVVDGIVRQGILSQDKRRVTIRKSGRKITLPLQTSTSIKGRQVLSADPNREFDVAVTTREILVQDKDGNFLICES